MDVTVTYSFIFTSSSRYLYQVSIVKIEKHCEWFSSVIDEERFSCRFDFYFWRHTEWMKGTRQISKRHDYSICRKTPYEYFPSLWYPSLCGGKNNAKKSWGEKQNFEQPSICEIKINCTICFRLQKNWGESEMNKRK